MKLCPAGQYLARHNLALQKLRQFSYLPHFSPSSVSFWTPAVHRFPLFISLFLTEVGSLLTWVEREPPQDTEESYLRKVDFSAAWTLSIRLQARLGSSSVVGFNNLISKTVIYWKENNFLFNLSFKFFHKTCMERFIVFSGFWLWWLCL